VSDYNIRQIRDEFSWVSHSVRVMIIVLGAAAVLIAIWSSGWFQSVPTDPAFPGSPSGVTNTHRLAYHFDATPLGPLRGIVNDDPFAWTNVHVEVAARSMSFQCPTLSAVNSASSLRIQSAMCHAADGSVPSRVCVVRVTAKEGSITSAFEPCLRVE
jgi:hypothetical protein